MRQMNLALFFVAAFGPAASATSQDDLAFTQHLIPSECFNRAFTPEEFDRLKSIMNIDPREFDRTKKQAAFFAQSALRCQNIYQQRAQKENEAASRENKRNAAIDDLPDCQLAYQTGNGLDAISLLPQTVNLGRLAEAGDFESACPQLNGLVNKLEAARAAFVTCFKAVRGDGEGAEILKEDALKHATELNQLKSSLSSSARSYKCPP